MKIPGTSISKRKSALFATGTGVLLLAAAGFAFHRNAAPSIPTAEVRRGEFVAYLQVRGEIRALKSVQLTAPSIAGDLQIIKLARPGTMVKKGDVVVEFDTTTLRRTLEQKQSELKSADADIDHSRAEARLTDEQQATDVLQARYNVERAKLDASKQEILSEIEGAENKLKLSDSEQKLKELQQKTESNKHASEAEIASKKQKREKALFDVRQTERQIAMLTLRAPADGMVTLLPNFRARSFGPGTPPEFKEGDRAWGGAVIAELPDLSSIRVNARVDETDRGRLKVTQTASVRVDAVPDRELPAAIAEISPLAKLDYSAWPFTKNFDVAVQILNGDPRIRPGMNANARIAVEKVPDSVLVPAEAVFDRNGRSVAYVLHGSKFEERVVQTSRRSQKEISIASGLRSGERVALKDPTMQNRGPK